MLFNFLQNINRDKIKRATLIGNNSDGGLEMLIVEIYAKTLKLKWLKPLSANDNANWKTIPISFWTKMDITF